MALSIESSAFRNGEEIPTRYTCVGQNVSPPLAWSGVPEKTRSLALIADDPDAPDPKAPKTVWVHWVLYGLSPSVKELPQGAGKHAPPGARDGVNDSGQTGYDGPCPPVGRHRYFFKLYALDVELPDLDSPTKQRLEKAMQGHVLAQAELMGTYQKSK